MTQLCLNNGLESIVFAFEHGLGPQGKNVKLTVTLAIASLLCHASADHIQKVKSKA